MKRWPIAVFGLLVVYSIVLVAIELRTSQDFVRHFVTDIEGPVPFYAVNTTLTVFLMGASALLFLVAAYCVGGAAALRRRRWFLWSQAAIFAFLAFDDRFLFHEKVAGRLGIGDHYVMLTTATVEACCLMLLGGFALLKNRAAWFLAAGVVLFLVMLVFDAIVPHDMVLRLSIEDLAKAWACVCFSLFAWHVCKEEIDRLALVRSGAGDLLAGVTRDGFGERGASAPR